MKCKDCEEHIENREGYNYCDDCWALKLQGKKFIPETSGSKTLSDKIVQDGRHPEYDRDVLTCTDVKKAVRRLKENIEVGYSCVCDKQFKRLINKIFGREICE